MEGYWMQNKFLKQNTRLISTIKSAIKSEIKRRNFQFDHEVFNIKHLTECPRRIMYRANAYPAAKPNFLTNFNKKYTKRKWVDFFDYCKEINVTGRDISASDCNFNIVGYADAIIQYGDVTSVLFIDCLFPSEYKQAKKMGGMRRQIVELMMTMWLTEVPNGIMICENKENNEYFISHVVPHQPIINGARNKCTELLEKQILQELPDRSYKDENGDECKICEYKTTCWNKKEKLDAEKDAS